MGQQIELRSSQSYGPPRRPVLFYVLPIGILLTIVLAIHSFVAPLQDINVSKMVNYASSKVALHKPAWILPAKSHLGFDHVYLITRKEAINRQEIMRQRLNYLNVDYETVYASEASSPEAQIFMKTFYKEEVEWRNPPGAWALMLTQRRIIEDALAKNYTDFLMLEDDADFEMDTEVQVADLKQNMDQDWEMLWLGYCNSVYEENIATNHTRLFRPIAPECTHALGISRAGAINLLENTYAAPYGHCPIDSHLITRLRNNEINAYIVSPMLSVQTRTEISSISWEDDGTRFPALNDSVATRLGQVTKMAARRSRHRRRIR